MGCEQFLCRRRRQQQDNRPVGIVPQSRFMYIPSFTLYHVLPDLPVLRVVNSVHVNCVILLHSACSNTVGLLDLLPLQEQGVPEL